MQKVKNSIGIFDSGIGGTSIWKEIQQLLPKENTLYLSDSKNAPYGNRTKEEIIELSIKNTEFLLKNDCKIIVVACNTATTNAIKVLRQKYTIPFIGIEPAIKPAALQTKTNVIGILATKGTLNSELFEKTSANLDSKLTIMERVGEGLVDLIEKGKIYSSEMTLLLEKYLTPMIEANVDCIVLGCTHYPYLKNQIEAIVGPSVKIIDSGYAVAMQTQNILKQHNLLNLENLKASHKFCINIDKTVLTEILEEHVPPGINISIEETAF
ncbi:glutamate racemase [Tenacibaculum sp. TC6]|uniref:glutamate racemase n=1 Tax=Tenacibaculum sp. TC6 TaxID=3423223 RepID=UPI003D366D0E